MEVVTDWQVFLHCIRCGRGAPSALQRQSKIITCSCGAEVTIKYLLEKVDGRMVWVYTLHSLLMKGTRP